MRIKKNKIMEEIKQKGIKMLFKQILFAAFIASMILLAGCKEEVSVPELGEDIGDKVIVFKTSGCGCCEGYLNELNRQGFNVEVNEVETDTLTEIKNKYNVPMELRSCHTAFVNGYFIEGHVPIEAVRKMLEEKPDIDGIALEGMPPGSPGMPGTKTGLFIIFAVKDGQAEEYVKI